MALLVRQLFTPDDEDKKNTTTILEQIAAVGAAAFICELRDPKKATPKSLSAVNGQSSYN